MDKDKTVRFWKDEDFRLSVSNQERPSFQDNPAGPLGLSDSELEFIAGGSTELFTTIGCCSGFTSATCTCTTNCNPTFTYACK